MNREKFLVELEKLLMDIPQEERDEAIAYYNGYFEDAGIENEAKIIQELISPEQVAKTIKTDMGISAAQEYTEYGYRDGSQKDRQELSTTEAGNKHDNQTNREEWHSSRMNGSESILKKPLWILIIALVSSPIWLPIVTGLIGALAGIIFGIFGIVLSIVIVVAVFYISGFALLATGIAELFVGAAAIGFALTGLGFMFIALAILGTILCVWMFRKFIPWFVALLSRLYNKIFKRERKSRV